ncbi:hypothetical protein DPMN_072878 [Dreissena polymorpha]|uniref:Uncharacterized protein n=1 Tax=Dreissena polymorpha TaxID=45954 RepID=A0A9D4HC73_DREPO|nr:hypothetical protein DPMN_072878 [Dreissena polymorpha]
MDAGWSPLHNRECFFNDDIFLMFCFSYSTGSAVLSPTRLVLVDNNNMAVKMVDTKERVVITTVRFKSEPRDVTVLTRLDAIAVTLPEEWKIQFLSTRYYNIFELLSAIVVNGKCECVDYCDGKLFVSYLFSSPSRVEIMTLDGTVLKVLKRDSEGNPLFTWPDYLTVWKDHIFISNYWNSTVLKLTTEGAVVSSYHDAGLRWPRGVISTGDGHILICSRYTNNIHIITDAGVKVGILLCAKDGLERPWSLCYCPASRRLYVSSYSPQEKHGNYIRVYQFKDPEETNVT